MEHKHEWRGAADGVICAVCGKTLTAAEYIAEVQKKQNKAFANAENGKEIKQAKRKGAKKINE